MKITCTEEEKKSLIEAIREYSSCKFLDRDQNCENFETCEKCIEGSIEWEMEGGE